MPCILFAIKVITRLPILGGFNYRTVLKNKINKMLRFNKNMDQHDLKSKAKRERINEM